MPRGPEIGKDHVGSVARGHGRLGHGLQLNVKILMDGFEQAWLGRGPASHLASSVAHSPPPTCRSRSGIKREGCWPPQLTTYTDTHGSLMLGSFT